MAVYVHPLSRYVHTNSGHSSLAFLQLHDLSLQPSFSTPTISYNHSKEGHNIPLNDKVSFISCPIHNHMPLQGIYKMFRRSLINTTIIISLPLTILSCSLLRFSIMMFFLATCMQCYLFIH